MYTYNDKETKDLAIVTVLAGYKTPLQRVLQGSRTVEGFVKGEGTLQIIDTDNKKANVHFLRQALDTPASCTN